MRSSGPQIHPLLKFAWACSLIISDYVSWQQQWWYTAVWIAANIKNWSLINIWLDDSNLFLALVWLFYQLSYPGAKTGIALGGPVFLVVWKWLPRSLLFAFCRGWSDGDWFARMPMKSPFEVCTLEYCHIAEVLGWDDKALPQPQA